MAEAPAGWDDEVADGLEGAVVLVGVTYADPAGERMEQLYCVVEAAAPDKGILLSLRGSRDGETFWLPPDLQNLTVAGPGRYRLRSTGDVVVDPDYTATWTVHPPRA